MTKYENGKIYKIVSDCCDLVYYGSTTQKLCRRMADHRSRWRKGKGSCRSKKIFEQDSKCKIILVENVPCENKEELTARERYYIENFECVNKYIPGRTQKEYYEKNKEKLNQKQKEYYNENKEKIAQQKKDYYGKNKEKLNQKQKEYREANKEKIAQRNKEYRGKNKEKILQHKKQKIQCACGSAVRRDNVKRHQSTKKHINYITNIL